MPGLDNETRDMILDTLRKYAERKLTLDFLIELDHTDTFPRDVLQELYDPMQLGLVFPYLGLVNHGQGLVNQGQTVLGLSHSCVCFGQRGNIHRSLKRYACFQGRRHTLTHLRDALLMLSLRCQSPSSQELHQRDTLGKHVTRSDRETDLGLRMGGRCLSTEMIHTTHKILSCG